MGKRIWFVLLVAMLMAACRDEQRTLYHHYEPVQGRVWAADDTLRFQLPAAPHDGYYPCYLSLRLRPAFPYTGVWLVAETRIDSTLARRDTLFHPNPANGTPDQRHGSAMQQHEQPLCTLRLAEGQQTEILVYHHMDTPLSAVSDVGVRVSVSDK